MHASLSRCSSLIGALSSIFFLSHSANAELAPLWARAVSSGGRGADQAYAVKADPSANKYVVGSFSSTAHFGAQTLSSSGQSDIFIAKYGPGDQRLWALKGGGPGEDLGTDVGIDRDGNIYVTGFFSGSASFFSTNGDVESATGTGESTIFLAKYSADGVLEWLHTGNGTFGLNHGYGVAVERTTSTIYFTAVGQGPTRFSSSDASVHTVPGPGTWHMILVKYDTDGTFQWGQYNEASPNSVPRKVAVDAAQAAYVTGWLESGTTFHGTNGHSINVFGRSAPVQTFPYPDDAFIAKYDRNGNVKWVNTIGGYKAIGTDVAVGRDGLISTTGFIGNIGNGTPEQAETIVTSQPGGADINLGGGTYTDPYNPDAFIATYDESGRLLNAIRIGGAQTDGGTGITYDRDSNLYVAGVFQGTVDFGGIEATGTQASNLFVLKYTPPGLAWVKTADGAGSTEQLEVNARLSVTNWGRVLVAGGYRQTATFDGITLHSAGAEDIFLSELSQGGDTTPPVITPSISGTFGDNGWFTSNVTLSFTVTEAESPGSLTTTGCDPVTVSSDTPGVSFTCQAGSNGGTDSKSITIKRDATAPTLAPAVSPNPVEINGSATASPNAGDATSGVAVSACDPVDTASVGAHSVDCTATDQAGNTASAAASYVVTVTCHGLTATIVGTPAGEILTGTQGDDVIHGLGGDDTIIGGGGNDVLCGGEGDDVLRGNRGNDRLFGGKGNDDLFGGKGNDRLCAGRDNDRLFGGTGNDRLLGGTGTDRCDGGPPSEGDTASGCESVRRVP